MDQKQRCVWCGEDPLYVAYHDEEWGVPVKDDQALFAALCLESMQSGLSWITVLRKRAHFYKVFAGFCPEKLVHFSNAQLAQLLLDPGIIRHAGKIAAVIHNARCYLTLQSQISFTEFVWRERNPKALAKALKQAGFKFVGERTCYAFMQAVGMVNDHTRACYRYTELGGV